MRFVNAVLFGVIILAGCTTKYSEIEKVKVYYMSRYSTSSIPITCDEILAYKHTLKDSLITDGGSLKKLGAALNKLEIHEGDIPEWSIEIRKKIFVKYKDSRMDTLCLGDFRGVIFNGVRMKESPELYELFDF